MIKKGYDHCVVLAVHMNAVFIVFPSRSTMSHIRVQ